MFGWLRGSVPKSPKLQAAEKYFQPSEVEVMVSQLQSLVKGTINPTAPQQPHRSEHAAPAGLPDAAFLRQVCGLPDNVAAGPLGHNLCCAVRGGEPGTSVSPEDIVLAKAKCERMDDSAAVDFTFSILDPGATGAASREALQDIITAAAELCLAPCTGGAGPPLLMGSCAEAAAAGALATAGSSDGKLTREGYGKWCKVVPAVHQVLSSLFSKVGSRTAPAAGSSTHGAAAASSSGSTGGSTAATSSATPAPSTVPSALTMPRLVVGPQYRPQDCLMTMQRAWLLSHCLAQDMREEWQLLFTSDRDGKSFNTMVGRVGEHALTLIIIKDKAGHVFGGFAPMPWQKNGSFYGDFSTFVFGLEPATTVHHAIGINQNFQWCGIGFAQLPNGFGFGGIPGGHFSVFVDSSLDRGISRPMATFGNPPLAHEQSFEVAAVECWLLKPPEEDPWAPTKGSVLDTNKEAQALLEAAGIQMHSHGYREPVRDEDL